MPFSASPKQAKSSANTPATSQRWSGRSFDDGDFDEAPQTDVGTQLSHATQFGHSLGGSQPAIQRETMPEEEEEVQMKPQLQREAMPEEEELQRQPEEEEELQTKAIQPKLTIGQPGDKYEQEADSMAAKVMAMPDSAVQREAMPEKEEELQAKSQLQREAMPEEEDELQMKPQLQREAMPEKEDEPLQTKPDNPKSKFQNPKLPSLQAKGAAPTAPANFDNQLAQHKGSGQPLSDETRAFMEPRFGADFSNVRVHETPDLANAIQAQAFTHGQDIYFDSGKYNPGSSGGKELLAHELTHVVQQVEPQIKRSEFKSNQEDQTYWDWYHSSKGKLYQTFREELEPLGYEFRRRVAIGQNADGSRMWKEGSPQKETLAKDVAWVIKLPSHQGDKRAWVSLDSINDRCEGWLANEATCSENQADRTNPRELRILDSINKEFGRRNAILRRSFGVLEGFEILQAETEFEAQSLANRLGGEEGYAMWQEMQNDKDLAQSLFESIVGELIEKVNDKIVGGTFGTVVTIAEGIGLAYDYLWWQRSLEYRKTQIYYYLLWQVANQFSGKNDFKANQIYQKLSQQTIRNQKWQDSKEYQELLDWYDKALNENLTAEQYRAQTQPALWAR